MIYNISAVILAGGENKRFRRKPKTEIIVGGRKIISRMLDVIREIFDEIIIVTNSPEKYADLGKCKITGDIYLKSGPLGGIHSAMRTSQKGALFIFAGDMPFLDKDLIISQITKFGDSNALAMVPVINDLEEPLHAIYRNSLSGEIEKILEGPGNISIKDFLNSIHTEYFIVPASPENLKVFSNINTPSDLEKAELNLE